MPRYVYRCRKCDASFMTVHGITEDQDHCEVCFESGCVFRIPQMPTVKVVKEKAGHIVREYIEDTKREMKREKQSLKQKEYDPS